MAFIKGRCEPAYTIVSLLGGVTQTAKVCGITAGAVSRWMSPDGGNGMIPFPHWERIINYTRKRNINIDVYDLSGIEP